MSCYFILFFRGTRDAFVHVMELCVVFFVDGMKKYEAILIPLEQYYCMAKAKAIGIFIMRRSITLSCLRVV